MTHPQKRTLGSELKAKREARGLSIRALAAAADLAPSSVLRLEKDEIGATDDTLRRLAKLLRTPYRDLAALSGDLPAFAPYLRAKYDLSNDAIAELEAHFAAVTESGSKHRRQS